jgi:hypothetical protein
VSESRPKRKYSRVKSQLELLAARGNISQAQRQAGERLERDYYDSNTIPCRLIGRYEVTLEQAPKRYQGGGADTPANIAARERFEAAVAAVGPGLADELLHVAVLDLRGRVGPMNGPGHDAWDAGAVYTALDALCAHYGERRRTAA